MRISICDKFIFIFKSLKRIKHALTFWELFMFDVHLLIYYYILSILLLFIIQISIKIFIITQRTLP